MKLSKIEDIQVGVVVWFLTSDMIPAKGDQLDQHALAKLHPYVCTGVSNGGGSSQWLFLTSDQYRGDGGCCFQSVDKEGDAFWTSKNSYFQRNNCAVSNNPFQLFRLSQNDKSLVVNRVKITALTPFGLDTMAVL